MFYNAYLIKNVYFRTGIIQLTLNQELKLIRIYKQMILWKLRLSKKFPRRILYVRKSVLGIGIMKPSTIVDTLALKLYISYKRQGSRILKLI